MSTKYEKIKAVIVSHSRYYDEKTKKRKDHFRTECRIVRNLRINEVIKYPKLKGKKRPRWATRRKWTEWVGEALLDKERVVVVGLSYDKSPPRLWCHSTISHLYASDVCAMRWHHPEGPEHSVAQRLINNNLSTPS